jgi:hypothetical protein
MSCGNESESFSVLLSGETAVLVAFFLFFVYALKILDF